MKTHPLHVLTLAAFFGATLMANAAQPVKPPKAPKPPKPPKPAHNLTFPKADLDASGTLTLLEFMATQGPGTPLVEVRSRFLAMDVAGAFAEVLDPATGLPMVDPVTGQPVAGDPIPDGLVSLDEWNAYKALEIKPVPTLTRFELADFDGDGQLTPVEFGYLVSPKVPARNTLRGFDKLDVNDDGMLSPAECTKTLGGTP